MAGLPRPPDLRPSNETAAGRSVHGRPLMGALPLPWFVRHHHDSSHLRFVFSLCIWTDHVSHRHLIPAAMGLCRQLFLLAISWPRSGVHPHCHSRIVKVPDESHRLINKACPKPMAIRNSSFDCTWLAQTPLTGDWTRLLGSFLPPFVSCSFMPSNFSDLIRLITGTFWQPFNRRASGPTKR
jgi:hypothetical protein